MNNISEKGFYLTFFDDTPYVIQMSGRKNGGLAIVKCMWTYDDAVNISDFGMPSTIQFTVPLIPLCCF
jgi:hypothetical protein